MYERVKVNTLQGYENVLDIYEVDKFGKAQGDYYEENTAHGYPYTFMHFLHLRLCIRYLRSCKRRRHGRKFRRQQAG